MERQEDTVSDKMAEWMMTGGAAKGSIHVPTGKNVELEAAGPSRAFQMCADSELVAAGPSRAYVICADQDVHAAANTFGPNCPHFGDSQLEAAGPSRAFANCIGN